MITMPFSPNSLRAAWHAFVHFWKALPANLFLAQSDAFFETIFPRLFFLRLSFFKPPEVFSFDPRSTIAFAIFPFAMTDFFMAFFMAFMTLTFFMALAFMAAFIVFMAPAAFFMPM